MGAQLLGAPTQDEGREEDWSEEDGIPASVALGASGEEEERFRPSGPESLGEHGGGGSSRGGEGSQDGDGTPTVPKARKHGQARRRKIGIQQRNSRKVRKSTWEVRKLWEALGILWNP